MTGKDKKIETSPEVRCPSYTDNDYMINDSVEPMVTKPNLLLHSCCGPCSTSVIERLVDEFNVTVFFFNPCITDQEEYMKRRTAQIQFIEQFNEENLGRHRIVLREGDYCPGAFFEATQGLGNEPEGGARCTVCFKQRLEKTAEEANMLGMDYFGTTLTVSPHKNYKLISEIGRELAVRHGISFLDRDFKKKDGFARSIKLSKKYNLYRQNYCGCKYSERER